MPTRLSHPGNCRPIGKTDAFARRLYALARSAGANGRAKARTARAAAAAVADQRTAWRVHPDIPRCRGYAVAGGGELLARRGSRPGRPRRPCARAFPRRPECEGPPRRRRPCTPQDPACHRGPGGRRTGIRDRHGGHPCSAKRARKSEDPIRCRPGGPRVLIPRDPKSPRPTRDPYCPREKLQGWSSEWRACSLRNAPAWAAASSAVAYGARSATVPDALPGADGRGQGVQASYRALSRSVCSSGVISEAVIRQLQFPKSSM